MRQFVFRSAIVVSAFTCVLTLLPGATTAHAAENPFINAGEQVIEVRDEAGVNAQSLEVTVGRLIKAALSLTGVFFFGYIVWAGYLWMTAHGESDKIETAKKMISGAIIGLALTLAAYAITVFVVSRLTAPANEGGVGVIQP